VVKRQRGYTMMEIVVTLAVFGVFLMIIVGITLEMRKTEAKYPVNFMVHPEVAGLVARMRKDVFDTKYYPATFQTYEQTSKTLILYTLQKTGFAETVVYDFNTDGEVHRKSYNASQLTGDWVARGVPTFEISSFELDTGQQAVRISAKDKKGVLGIDEIFLPRPHD
jgi:prepilin-type N-terminal cleavage/methylation domain-containing protein